MLKLRKTIETAGTRAKLDDALAAVRRETEGVEVDPFDDALMAAVAGVADAMKAEANALAEVEARMGNLVRRT